MKRACLLLLVLLLVFLFPPQASAVDPSGTARLQESLQVFSNTLSTHRALITPLLLQKTSGIVIIPRLVKASFLFGARTGKGVLVVKDANGNWSNPVLISVKGLSVGLQAGVQSSDVVMIIMKSRALEAISRGNFIFGADVSLVAGLLGIQLDETTDSNLQTEIYSFSDVAGLNAGFALQGSSLRIEEAATSALYGKSTLSSRDILSGKIDPVPIEVLRFKETITRVAGKGQ